VDENPGTHHITAVGSRFGLKEAVVAGEILGSLQAKGTLIGVEDLLIGAIARATDLSS